MDDWGWPQWVMASLIIAAFVCQLAAATRERNAARAVGHVLAHGLSNGGTAWILYMGGFW